MPQCIYRASEWYIMYHRSTYTYPKSIASVSSLQSYSWCLNMGKDSEEWASSRRSGRAHETGDVQEAFTGLKLCTMSNLLMAPSRGLIRVP